MDREGGELLDEATKDVGRQVEVGPEPARVLGAARRCRRRRSLLRRRAWAQGGRRGVASVLGDVALRFEERERREAPGVASCADAVSVIAYTEVSPPFSTNGSNLESPPFVICFD